MISTVTTTITTVTISELMTFLSIIAVISLIIFLAIKEILRSEIENKKVKSFLKGVNIAIIPLLLIFIAIVGSKILKIL
jgi:uncharacterized membrane protein YjgN (DUF898 family)